MSRAHPEEALMRRTATLTMSLLLLAVATAGQAEPGANDSPSETVVATKSAAAPNTAGAPMAEVTIDPTDRGLVCRRYVPTGSRIATRVCEPPRDSLTTQEQADRDTMRRDFAEMRELQMMRRAQAQAEAMRRAMRQ